MLVTALSIVASFHCGVFRFVRFSLVRRLFWTIVRLRTWYTAWMTIHWQKCSIIDYNTLNVGTNGSCAVMADGDCEEFEINRHPSQGTLIRRLPSTDSNIHFWRLKQVISLMSAVTPSPAVVGTSTLKCVSTAKYERCCGDTGIFDVLNADLLCDLDT